MKAPGSSNPRVGLCADCRHCQRVASGRGSIFYMCTLAQSDSRFVRYPRLPVISCDGFKPGETQQK